MVWLGRAARWLDDSLSYACQQCWSYDCNVNKTHNTMTTVLWIIPSIYQTWCQYSSKLLSLYNNTVSTCVVVEFKKSTEAVLTGIKMSPACWVVTVQWSWQAVLCCVEAAQLRLNVNNVWIGDIMCVASIGYSFLPTGLQRIKISNRPTATILCPRKK